MPGHPVEFDLPQPPLRSMVLERSFIYGWISFDCGTGVMSCPRTDLHVRTYARRHTHTRDTEHLPFESVQIQSHVGQLLFLTVGDHHETALQQDMVRCTLMLNMQGIGILQLGSRVGLTG